MEQTGGPTGIPSYKAIVQCWRYTHGTLGVPGIFSPVHLARDGGLERVKKGYLEEKDS